MLKRFFLFPLIFLVTTVAVGTLSFNIYREAPLTVVSDDRFASSLSNEGVKEFEAALAQAYPEWAALQIRYGDRDWTIGSFLQVISGPGSWAAASPEVMVVTLGVKYDWQVPGRMNLADEFISISIRLTKEYADFLKRPEIRRQYPQVGNAATYALYRYFREDVRKLQEWRIAYTRIFGVDPVVPLRPQSVQQQGIPDGLIPFMERPFEAPASARYPVRSFIDHYWPLWPDPDNQLHRFDGRTFSFVIAGVSAYSSHQGIDYAMDGAEIYPVAEGVVYQEPDPLCGEVLVYHESLGVLTQYMHMRDIQVTQDQYVYPRSSPGGTVLGYASNVSSARCPIFPDANGTLPPHLHLSVVAGDLETRYKWDYIEPFGWWGEGDDPLEAYDQGLWQSGSRWLWKGDKIAEDGEAQAELFHPLDEAYHWQRDVRGYQGDSWWNTTRTNDSGQIWGVWGTFFTEEEAGQYAVYATWPQDEQNTTQAHYYIYGNGVRETVLVDQRNQGSTGNGDFWYCLGSFNFGPGSAVVILRDWVEDSAEAGKRVYFDAVKWEPGPCATPIPTPTPTLPTPPPDLTPGPGEHLANAPFRSAWQEAVKRSTGVGRRPRSTAGFSYRGQEPTLALRPLLARFFAYCAQAPMWAFSTSLIWPTRNMTPDQMAVAGRGGKPWKLPMPFGDGGRRR